MKGMVLEPLQVMQMHTPTTRRVVIKARRATPRTKRPLARHEQGRVCDEAGCISVLSVYNKQGVCYAHQKRKPPRLRGRVRRSDL